MKNIKRNKGFGYKDTNGTVCMKRCFKCGKENWALVVAAGYCAWCLYNPNKKKAKR